MPIPIGPGQPGFFEDDDVQVIEYLGSKKFLLNPDKLNDWLLYVKGLIDTKEVNDIRPPVLSWAGVSQIDVAAAPGSLSSVVSVPFQDAKTRVFDGTISFDPSSVGEGGRDTGSEAVNGIYSIFGVPKVADDDEVVLRGTLDPDGPSGYTNFAYMGSVINKNADLLRFSQIGASFFLHALRPIESFAHQIAADELPVAVDLSLLVPKSAGVVFLSARIQSQPGGAGIVYFYVDGSQTGSHFDFIQTTATDTDWTQRRIVIPTPGVSKRFYRKINESVGDLSTYVIQLSGWVDTRLS